MTGVSIVWYVGVLQVANKEYYSLEIRYTKKCNECESKVREYQTRLEAYESIEKELDEVIMQAAEGNSRLTRFLCY